MPRDDLPRRGRAGFTLQIADDVEGPAIKALLIAHGYHYLDSVSFKKVAPNWIVCYDAKRKLVGALQVCPGHPITRLEHLGLDPSLSVVRKQRVFKLLVDQGMMVAKGWGSELVGGIVKVEDILYKQALEKRGGLVLCTGHHIVARI